jgi:archaeal flagellin FlaB
MTIMVGLAGTIMLSGFSSSDTTKEVLQEEIKKTVDGLRIVGKITGYADVANDKIMVTATPVMIAAGGAINVSPDILKINYNLIRINSNTISYENIHAGSLKDGTYNSVKSAVAEAKRKGLIEVDPYTDIEKPSTTTSFVYWIMNQNSNNVIEGGELAVLAIVYAEKDRPSTDEHLLIRGINNLGEILTIDRIIPHISNEIVDVGGKIRE